MLNLFNLMIARKRKLQEMLFLAFCFVFKWRQYCNFLSFFFNFQLWRGSIVALYHWTFELYLWKYTEIRANIPLNKWFWANKRFWANLKTCQISYLKITEIPKTWKFLCFYFPSTSNVKIQCFCFSKLIKLLLIKFRATSRLQSQNFTKIWQQNLFLWQFIRGHVRPPMQLRMINMVRTLICHNVIYNFTFDIANILDFLTILLKGPALTMCAKERNILIFTIMI